MSSLVVRCSLQNLSLNTSRISAQRVEEPGGGLAVGFAVAYVLLAIYRRHMCWIAIAGAALYIVIFWQVQLYLEAALRYFISRWRSTAGSPEQNP